MSNVVGLSGGIGSGKTTVARMLEKPGAVIIDAAEGLRSLCVTHTPHLAR